MTGIIFFIPKILMNASAPLMFIFCSVSFSNISLVTAQNTGNGATYWLVISYGVTAKYGYQNNEWKIPIADDSHHGQFPPDNSHPDNSHLDNSHPKNLFWSWRHPTGVKSKISFWIPIKNVVEHFLLKFQCPRCERVATVTPNPL